jgi:hypothetical protein
VAQTGDADGRSILQDLNRLKDKHEAGTFGPEDQKEEDALFSRAQELAKRNAQLKAAVGQIPRADAAQNQPTAPDTTNSRTNGSGPSTTIIPQKPKVANSPAPLNSSTVEKPPVDEMTATPAANSNGTRSAGQPPEEVAEQACSNPLPQPIQYGDFSLTITHCGLRENQVRLSGKIQNEGPEKVLLFFHPFKAFDDAANLYIVQEGRFGSSESFGRGHSDQLMYPHTSTPFSLVIEPKDGASPPGAAVTVVMPCSDQLGGQVRLNLTLR